MSKIKFPTLYYLKKEWRKEINIFKNQPFRLALSLSLGVFIGFTPTIGFQTILCYLVSQLLDLSFIGTFTGSSIPTGIPYLIPFTYYFCYKVGTFLLKIKTNFSIHDFKNMKSFLFYSLINIGKPLIVGCFFCAFIGAILTFLLSFFLINRFKKNKKNENY
ncbi:MAG: DUF2062 domain-containing protein [bacterium]|nr:DUF2062 domain-containing protein [bacterium]MCX7917557.1 DUF2062 domain-containing protein [bacterium]MDW8163139.1 DUF2062 domain-containing protein [Candidatus Omnitrophota bacterium]